MPIPSLAVLTSESMDPYDIVDFQIDCRGLLEPYEMVASYTIVPLSESVLLGLQIAPTGYPSSVSQNIITFWAKINPLNQSDVIFQNTVLMPVEVSITTNSTPARKRQRTVVLKVMQR